MSDDQIIFLDDDTILFADDGTIAMDPACCCAMPCAGLSTVRTYALRLTFSGLSGCDCTLWNAGFWSWNGYVGDLDGSYDVTIAYNFGTSSWEGAVTTGVDIIGGEWTNAACTGDKSVNYTTAPIRVSIGTHSSYSDGETAGRVTLVTNSGQGPPYWNVWRILCVDGELVAENPNHHGCSRTNVVCGPGSGGDAACNPGTAILTIEWLDL